MSSVRYDSKTVADVKRLAAGGWSHREIRDVMASEHGTSPSCETIARWLNPKYAEASRARVRRREVKTRAKHWTFRLPAPGGNYTPEYKAAFIVRLRAEAVPTTSIAKVCTIVFGETWNRERVKRSLGMA